MLISLKQLTIRVSSPHCALFIAPRACLSACLSVCLPVCLSVCLLAGMIHRSKNLSYFLSLVPGKRRLGTYRFLPIFFCIGGVMEWIMINVRIGRETFYDVYRRKKSEREYQEKIADGLIVHNAPAAK